MTLEFVEIAADRARWRSNFHAPASSQTRREPQRPPEAPKVRSVPRMTLRERIVYTSLVVVGMGLVVAFAYFWFTPSSIPNTFVGAYRPLDFLLFAGVTWVVWQQILMSTFLWFVAFYMKRPLPMTPRPGYRVAFITTFVPQSEPIELLHNILPALVTTDYPHDTWLLDEGGSADVQRICESYGVRYFSRQGIDRYNSESGSFTRTKGGNHNAWYDAHSAQYDIVAQMDTDFIPKSNFLTKTLGYFNDPDIAFVGTPQIYGNADQSRIARGAAEQLYGFYGPVMQGLSGTDSALMIGANHVVRVAALKDIGFYAGHLTEDLLTGMTLHTQHWKSVYVAEALAVGEGPATWEAFFTQQMRWAFGCIDILFTHSFRLFARMRPQRMLRYLVLQQHYFSGLSVGIGIALLTEYFVFGHAPSAIHLLPMFLLYFPLLGWQILISQWLQRFNVDPEAERGFLVHGMLVSIAVIPIYLLAMIGVVRRKRLRFKVTQKGDLQPSGVEPLSLFLPHFVLGTITAVGVAVGVALGHDAAVLVFWGCLNTALMYGLVAVFTFSRFRAKFTGRGIWSVLGGTPTPEFAAEQGSSMSSLLGMRSARTGRPESRSTPDPVMVPDLFVEDRPVTVPDLFVEDLPVTVPDLHLQDRPVTVPDLHLDDLPVKVPDLDPGHRPVDVPDLYLEHAKNVLDGPGTSGHGVPVPVPSRPLGNVRTRQVVDTIVRGE
jgi:cellulose synthase/poly-beta-1,6-N-acetylglucosamine synthase-like glycosyltransferase